MRVGLFQQSISIMMRMLLCYRYLMRPAYKPWIDEEDPIKLYGAASGIPGT
jgi:hypothetical protein